MRNRYSSLQIHLHWLTLLLIILTYACMWFRDFVPESYHVLPRLLHFNFGVAVWVVMLLRAVLRHKTPAPAITPALPQWQERASLFLHLALYLLFLALPVLGVLIVQFGGRELVIIGWHVPQFVTPDSHVRSLVRETHEFLANLGYFLIAFHALAALYHHYIRHDDTLMRMMPGK
jgi:cytochrome b561